jgi:hypothetical protein
LISPFSLYYENRKHIAKGESVSSSGVTFPTGIAYQGEGYISTKKIEEIFGVDIVWDGDSLTYSVIDIPFDQKIDEVVTKPDAAGNMWTYGIMSVIQNEYSGYSKFYLTATDKERGFERIYSIREPRHVWFGEDAVYFAFTEAPGGDVWLNGIPIMKLPYAETEDNPRGIVWRDKFEPYDFIEISDMPDWGSGDYVIDITLSEGNAFYVYILPEPGTGWQRQFIFTFNLDELNAGWVPDLYEPYPHGCLICDLGMVPSADKYELREVSGDYLYYTVTGMGNFFNLPEAVPDGEVKYYRLKTAGDSEPEEITPGAYIELFPASYTSHD